MSPLRACAYALCLLALAGCDRAGKAEKSGEAAPSTSYHAKPATLGAGVDVSGEIQFEGDPPAAVKIDMSQDPACDEAGQGDNLSQAFAVTGGKLANVYVYVKEGLPAAEYPAPAEAAVLDQKGCRYTPHVMAVMANQKIVVKNSDQAMHNVHPDAKNNRQWNVSQMPMGEPIEKTFSEPEVMLPVRCNQHPWMKMYVNVARDPFHAISGADGRFTLRGLPPGHYTIAAVHERMGEKTAQVDIGSGAAPLLKFTFSAGAER